MQVERIGPVVGQALSINDRVGWIAICYISERHDDPVLVTFRTLELSFCRLLMANYDTGYREVNKEIALGVQRHLEELYLFDEFAEVALHSVLLEFDGVSLDPLPTP